MLRGPHVRLYDSLVYTLQLYTLHTLHIAHTHTYARRRVHMVHCGSCHTLHTYAAHAHTHTDTAERMKIDDMEKLLDSLMLLSSFTLAAGVLTKFGHEDFLSMDKRDIE